MSDRFLTGEELREKQLSGLSPSQRKAYQAERARYFKGTIAVCVIYGVLALGLFLIAFLNARGREILVGDLFAFSATFIGGMLLIIIMLTVQVLNFKPPVVDNKDPGELACPDYWQLVKTPKEDLATMAEEDRYKMRFKCVNMQRGILNSASTAPVQNSTTDKVEKQLYDFGQSAYKNQTAGILDCNKVFPMMMSAEDKKANPDNPNLLRCKYAEKCGLTWSYVCPK